MKKATTLDNARTTFSAMCSRCGGKIISAEPLADGHVCCVCEYRSDPELSRLYHAYCRCLEREGAAGNFDLDPTDREDDDMFDDDASDDTSAAINRLNAAHSDWKARQGKSAGLNHG